MCRRRISCSQRRRSYPNPWSYQYDIKTSTKTAAVFSSTTTTSINDASLCRFCLADNHFTTKYPAIQPQLQVTVTNTHWANLPSILRRSLWYPQNAYLGLSLTKHGWTTSRQRPDLYQFGVGGAMFGASTELVSASNMPCLVQKKKPLANCPVANALVKQPFVIN